MCVDCSELKDDCPKDTFPLPRIDQIGDATVEHDQLSFMDALCYNIMPFNLKNARETLSTTNKSI